MLEWFKAGFGIGLGVIAAITAILMVLGLLDWLGLHFGKLRVRIRQVRET